MMNISSKGGVSPSHFIEVWGYLVSFLGYTPQRERKRDDI